MVMEAGVALRPSRGDDPGHGIVAPGPRFDLVATVTRPRSCLQTAMLQVDRLCLVYVAFASAGSFCSSQSSSKGTTGASDHSRSRS
jgi:hypothetical protein